MKVLHINQSDQGGGAGITAYRLHRALQSQGLESHLLVGKVTTPEPDVTAFPRWPWLESHLSRLNRNSISLNYVELLSSFSLPRHPRFQWADVLNFHNLHTGYFNYLALPEITRHKPAVWTLHDMWGFTGHCAYSYDCDRWLRGCGRCPYPQEYPPIRFDSSAWEWRLKRWVYGRSPLTIVAHSQWLVDLVKRSLLGRFPVQMIRAGLDLQQFQAHDPAICRRLLGLPMEGRVLLFGVDSLVERRKGGDFIVPLLQRLPRSLTQDLTLVMFGSQGSRLAEKVNIPVVNLGYLFSDAMKAIAYAAADLVLFPTRADNAPLVIQESLACGTPVISFRVGGVPEFIEPGVTGYLAEPENGEDLAWGVQSWLEKTDLAPHRAKCRQVAEASYSLTAQAEQYRRLYAELIGP